MIRFNPPYLMNVETNVGKIILKLVKKYFQKGILSHQIFNKNTFKVTYICMGNIASIISPHNRSVLNPEVALEYGCNYRSRKEYSLRNKYLTPKIIYRADVENNINSEQNPTCLEHHLRSISETAKKNFPIANTGIPKNCLSISGI